MASARFSSSATSRSASRASSPTTASLRSPAGRGARAPRRERRGQVDADEHPLRALPPGRGRDPASRASRCAELAARCDRPRHRDGAPALHAHPGDDGGREHRARRRAARRAASSSTRGAAERARARPLASSSASPVDPHARMEDITVGQQQRVEILKALYRGAEILILDEPTAVLTPQEAQELFTIVRSLTAQGKSIIFISHKLNEVLDIADRITVLRRGKLDRHDPGRRSDRGGPGAADGGSGRPPARREGRLDTVGDASRGARSPHRRRQRHREGAWRLVRRAGGGDRRPSRESTGTGRRS